MLVVPFVMIVIALSIVWFQMSSPIKAEKKTTTDSSIDLGSLVDPLLATEEDLHNQEEITNTQMEAYMDGVAYQNPLARANGKINGAMTDAVYQAQYATLNQQQNAEWNALYNFRPETKVATVSDWNSFRTAYEDNTVSKIVMIGDAISPTNNLALRRVESIEIDGQGHLIQMINGSLNVDDLVSLAAFTKNFSDVPVFHMHDVQIINNTEYGALEGNLGTAWSFINGRDQRGPGGGQTTPSRSRLWRYRMGNVYTPHDTTRPNNNQRVGGRLFNANRAEISIWGYNVIVTGAENFYTGGITYEPYTYYKGTNAEYDYSVIWFMDNTGAHNDPDSTGTRKFDVGEGSFVYLNYTNNGVNYPAVYEHWDAMNVGKNATYNANIAGTAMYFNVDNASFTAQEGATVNLLSRLSASTVRFRPVNNTHNSEWNPTNTKFEAKPGSKIFIVGNNSNGGENDSGVVSWRGLSNRAVNNQFILDSPETFDIRNTATTNNAFLGGNSTTPRGNQSFVIKNSDISIWNNATDIDGAPTYDYANVGEFQVTTAAANGAVTSTDSDLATQYNRTGFKRISGMNSTPELIWTPVTDADYSQRSAILIGYTAVGGTNPFDENGEAKIKPVYADGVRKAYADYTDTLGNSYRGVSTADQFVQWTKNDHTIQGFQLAGQELKGTPYRATMVGGTFTPYRIGVETPTTVIDVTPPEPAKLVGDNLTNATKQLLAENLEVNAKVFLSIDGGPLTAAGTVGADGKWLYNLPGYLTKNQTIALYLQDNAAVAPSTIVPAPPTTNSASGNINPAPSTLNYRDAVFKPATKYTVADILPDMPKADKSVKAYRENVEVNDTQSGDTLVYTITATNNKTAGIATTWKGVKISDVIPTGTKFDPVDTGIKINGIAPVAGDYDFNPAGNGILTFNVGDLATGETATVTFKVTVTQAAVGGLVTNKAKAEGYSPREAGAFVPGQDDPLKTRETYWIETNVIDNPGGTVFGVLSFASAPSIIDFGSQTVKSTTQRVDQPTSIQGDLAIQDSRATRKPWKLTARIAEPLSNGTHTIANALRYVYKGNEIILDSGVREVASQTNSNDTLYKVNSTWSAVGDGLKLQTDIGAVKASGNYVAKIAWELTDAP